MNEREILILATEIFGPRDKAARRFISPLSKLRTRIGVGRVREVPVGVPNDVYV